MGPFLLIEKKCKYIYHVEVSERKKKLIVISYNHMKYFLHVDIGKGFSLFLMFEIVRINK